MYIKNVRYKCILYLRVYNTCSIDLCWPVRCSMFNVRYLVCRKLWYSSNILLMNLSYVKMFSEQRETPIKAFNVRDAADPRKSAYFNTSLCADIKTHSVAA